MVPTKQEKQEKEKKKKQEKEKDNRKTNPLYGSCLKTCIGLVGECLVTYKG
jgi:hypothetical protein